MLGCSKNSSNQSVRYRLICKCSHARAAFHEVYKFRAVILNASFVVGQIFSPIPYLIISEALKLSDVYCRTRIYNFRLFKSQLQRVWFLICNSSRYSIWIHGSISIEMVIKNPHTDWSKELFEILSQSNVILYPYIPDAGNKCLIELAEKSNATKAILLTSEEEGVGVCAGAELVGKRGILCMQSSGVGNIPNFLSFVKGGGFPLLMMVSMRGEYGEQNPWQYPMGEAVQSIFDVMGVLTFWVQARDELEDAAIAACNSAHKGGRAAALILSQKFLGAKVF